jgi:hypothetical protein
MSKCLADPLGYEYSSSRRGCVAGGAAAITTGFLLGTAEACSATSLATMKGGAIVSAVGGAATAASPAVGIGLVIAGVVIIGVGLYQCNSSALDAALGAVYGAGPTTE